ncbi:exported hypothetical protein [Desulfamplus magnetovallimortis]|uniref:Uncharacterized protein n=1 Tax=Desulfamplus magnetovallimortis TaxID=1246637 RepID=A0A1W1HL47_9BACT|nr:hypothetical protein [Desulfamplus magnetovallimortis]SLM33092.1 exported hypothetical protein [Desulfamplus magnetovallimortis]
MRMLYLFKSNSQKAVMISLMLCIGIFLLYSKTITFDFVDYDDRTVLLAHPNLYNEESFTSSLKEILYNYFPREEPLILRDITWAINSYLFGFKNPMGYHLGNVIINSFNVALLFLVLFLNTNSLRLALLVSITYGVLPGNVEPVCWVKGRKDLLVSFLCYLP